MKLIRGRFPDMNEKICSQFVLLYLEISKKAEHAEISERALDLRGLLDALMLIRQGLTSGEALDMCIVNKSFDSYVHMENRLKGGQKRLFLQKIWYFNFFVVNLQSKQRMIRYDYLIKKS